MEPIPTDPVEIVQEWFAAYSKATESHPKEMLAAVDPKLRGWRDTDEALEWRLSKIKPTMRLQFLSERLAWLADRLRFDPNPLLGLAFELVEIDAPESAPALKAAWRIALRVRMRLGEWQESQDWVELPIRDLQKIFIEDPRTLQKRLGWKMRKPGGKYGKSVQILRGELPDGWEEKLKRQKPARK